MTCVKASVPQVRIFHAHNLQYIRDFDLTVALIPIAAAVFGAALSIFLSLRKSRLGFNQGFVPGLCPSLHRIPQGTKVFVFIFESTCLLKDTQVLVGG